MWLIVGLMLLFSYPVEASLCVEDNVNKCAALGFTEKHCEYGGVACYYNPSLWYCAKWTCEEGGYYTADKRPAGADCGSEPVNFKGLSCYHCITECPIGTVDYATCWEGKLAKLVDQPDKCAEWGYIHSTNNCTDYLRCPSDMNKVRCFN